MAFDDYIQIIKSCFIQLNPCSGFLFLSQYVWIIFSKTCVCEKKALNIIYAACAPQPFCLLIIQVHVPRCASCDEHPARQHQCLLRPHHPVVQQCFRFRQICCIKLRSKSLKKTYLLQLWPGPSCNWTAEDTRPLLEVVHIKNRPLFVVYLVVLWVFFFGLVHSLAGILTHKPTLYVC